MRKTIVIILLSVLFTAHLRANSSMPGFFQLGGNVSFIPFFKQDSTYLEKIQMQQEWVTVMLYSGFAVVKGEYAMRNLSDSTITFTMGYPINTQSFVPEADGVSFEDLYALQIKINGKSIKTSRIQDSTRASLELEGLDFVENWYTWQASFAPNTVTTVTVYFIVNTNNALLKRGYYSAEAQGFLYLLESGRVWAKTIEQGRVLIQLQEGVKLAEIIGGLPAQKLLTDGKNLLIWDFTNLEPTPKDNVVLRYGKPIPIDEFDFGAVIQNSATYFQAIDKIPIKTLSPKDWQRFENQDFDIGWSLQSTLTSIFLFLGFAGVPIAILVLGISTLIYYIVRAFRKKKTS